ncbi:hypothetical protein AWZ03_000543 [Drosophila navojoa]|uniref:Uncharacterized protein n=1 Tax=Drosophila navojoa TaxID=7232 RepID=A0A484BY98_DRONA|nr:hypothetical protein AWZ03_000543 [Drosophila navojoa]
MRQPALKQATISIGCCFLLLCSNSVGIAFADSFSDYFSDYECNQPLLERAVLTATSSLTERGPEKARLNAPANQTRWQLYSLLGDANSLVACRRVGLNAQEEEEEAALWQIS